MKENFFSPIASDYARFRPTYPPELYAFLAAVAPGRSVAWDCATGSGQAAHGLVAHFERVEATDISGELLAQAVPHAHITLRQADALRSGLGDASVDLVTVANAMHWFHGEAFAQEVRRVLRPGGVIAAWSYAFTEVSPEVDRITRRLHSEIVDDFWIGPNRLVEHGYKDLHFPFAPVVAPAMAMHTRTDLHGLEGYMRTWSASVKYRKHHGVDPVSLVHADLLAAWGDPGQERDVRWQLNLKVGRC